MTALTQPIMAAGRWAVLRNGEVPEKAIKKRETEIGVFTWRCSTRTYKDDGRVFSYGTGPHDIIHTTETREEALAFAAAMKGEPPSVMRDDYPDEEERPVTNLPVTKLPVDWEQRRWEAILAALPNMTAPFLPNETCARNAVELADALIAAAKEASHD